MLYCVDLHDLMNGSPALEAVRVVDAFPQQHCTLLNTGVALNTVAGKDVYCSLQNYLH